ncbi:MAG: NYN domain-containing protein [Candidatus Altiarchaeota archaeon]|nr:NYN domain-containing protein [Candidatus Altiarchaeota archaeon]
MKVAVPYIKDVKEKLGLGKDSNRIALFVDGPNLLRKEFNFDLEDLKMEVEKIGKIAIAKVFLNQFAPEKLIEAVSSVGMESVITPVDPDVALAVEVMEAVYNPNIDTICVVTRDGDFQPPIMKAKQHGKNTIAIGVRRNLSESLINSVDRFIELT